ncbi:MAG: GNAT family N-acetyltransferase [Flavobacteriales bacterium]|jgi:aryl-alcohol dehydrogenase-like predicted oxidoreductase|nr:GNAT family N-acetyltransferase [Flavobacteriales bacterium]
MSSRIIETERLVLKPMEKSIVSQQYVDWMNDPEVNKHLSSGGNETLESVLNFVNQHIEKQSYFWAIFVKEDHEHIGNIKIDPINAQTKSGEYGILLGDKNCWGKGYAREASEGVINFCFKTLQLDSITLGVEKENVGAFKLYQKIGFIITDEIGENTIPSYRMIKKNISVEKLALGTVQFGLDYGINNQKGKPTEARVFEILDQAFASGIRTLDTAEGYGTSMEVIGRYHQQSKNRFGVITKYSSSMKNLDDSFQKRVQKHLEVLKVDTLDAYLFHSFQDYKDHIEFNREDLLDLQKEGKIQKIGVSVYTNEEIEEVIQDSLVSIIQVPFNMLDNTSKRNQVFKKAKDKNIEIHCRSIFLQGLFFKDLEWVEKQIPELFSGVQKIQSLSSNNLSIQDLALNYVKQNRLIDKLVFGVDTKDQLLMNLDSFSKQLPQELIQEIDCIDIDKIELLNPSNWKI